MNRLLPIVFCLLLVAGRVEAQQRPLVTEDPETIGAGLVLIELGVDNHRDMFFPTSGLTGNLVRMPALGVSFGISPIAEVQIDGGYNRLAITNRRAAPLSDVLDFTGDKTTDFEDIFIATKIRLISETARRPAFAFRFGAKLPTARNERGIGTDTTDVHIAVLGAKTVQSIRFVGNVGMGILSDPTRGDRQNDVLTYGLSVARAIQEGLEVVAEVNGRLHTRAGVPPPGTESRGAMRVGGRFTRGTVRLDGGLVLGMTARDPSIGFTAGLTWVFRGFTVPGP